MSITSTTSHPLISPIDLTDSFDSKNSKGPSSPAMSIKNRHSFDVKSKNDSDQVIHHLIQPDDTLEGICVMYRVGVGEVKRINRLWTNDSIHLRKILEIPIQKSLALSGRPLSMPSRPPNAFRSIRASSSNESIHGARSMDDYKSSSKSNHSISNTKEHNFNHTTVSTRGLIDSIDKDVSSILQELKSMDWSIPTSPAFKRPKSPSNNIKDLRSKTTRVTITPLDPKSSSAFISDLVPLRVVFTLTPLVRTLPESVQTSIKASVLSKLKKSLSAALLERLAKDEGELYDMVVISDKTRTWNGI